MSLHCPLARIEAPSPRRPVVGQPFPAQGLLALALLALALPLSWPLPARAQEAPSEPTGQESTAEAPAVEPQRRANRARMNEGLRIWWNQPRYITALGLEEGQRQRMDSLLEHHREGRAELMTDLQETRRMVGDAAAAGDFEKADAQREKLAEVAAELSRLETGLMVSVLELMSAEQRALLAEKFSGVLRRPWLVGGGPGGMGVPWSARQRPGQARGPRAGQGGARRLGGGGN